MSNKQQTAVKWYLKKILDLDNLYTKGLITFGVYSTTKVYLQEKAKEMEKQKLEDAWVEGVKNWNPSKTFEDYYEKTYGGGEQ
jgi:hypothetical protein